MSVINLLYLVNNSLKSFLIVNSEVSEHLTVDLDTSLVQCTHQLAGIEINRKVLADLAVNNQEAFKAIVDKVK